MYGLCAPEPSPKCFYSATFLQRTVLLNVLVNVSISYTPGDIQLIFPNLDYVMYGMYMAEMGDDKCRSFELEKILSQLLPPALTDVGTDPRHAELTLLVLFMTSLRLANRVVNTPLCFRKKENTKPMHLCTHPAPVLQC